MSEIPVELRAARDILSQGEGGLNGIGVVLDADSRVTPMKRYEDLCGQLADLGWPQSPGEISSGTPKCGAFVLPDNRSPGNLETILIECARNVYPDLARGAERFTSEATTEPECGHLAQLAQYNKALVGCIANVLRPGKSMQTSIQDNRWISEHTLGIATVSVFQQFLRRLIA